MADDDDARHRAAKKRAKADKRAAKADRERTDARAAAAALTVAAPRMTTPAGGVSPELAPRRVPAPAAPSSGAADRTGLTGLSRVVGNVGGASLCFGEPVVAGERTVVPVARAKASGGWGWGFGTTAASPESGDGDGGGGGGAGSIEAVPMGFITIGPEGSRFEAIDDPERGVKALKAGAAAVATIVSAVVGARALGHGRSGGVVGRAASRFALPRGR